jgi:hypothetical protein
MITILITSIVYALLRAGHDSYLREGKWKTWATAQVFFISILTAYLLGGEWYQMLFSFLLFGITFWIVFDSVIGVVFGGNPLYIGNTGFDKKMRAMFQYNEKSKGLQYLIFKLVWYVIIFGSYHTLTK